MSKKNLKLRQRILARIEAIRSKILQMDYVCSGSLLKRTKVCGKPYCRCARDPEARHGPYWEWSRLEGGRLVHSVVSASQAKLLARAIRNHREIRKLLRRWERESLRAIKLEDSTKPR